MIHSPWKLTHDPAGTPVVLLDFGQRMEADISWASRRGAEVVPLLDSPVPFLRDGKNVSLQISYRVLVPEATLSDMFKGVMAGLISHQSLGKKPLKIEAQGVAEAHWLAAASMAPEVVAGLPANGSVGTFTQYTLVMAGITEVATGLPPIADPAAIPTDPGDFPAAAFSPTDPGSFVPSPTSDPIGMTLSGVTDPMKNGYLPKDGELNGRPKYSAVISGATMTVFWNDTVWTIYREGTGGLWLSGSDVAEPHLATGWYDVGVLDGYPILAPTY